MNKIIVIYGPTAVGKSDIAVLLAKKIDAEIISADSMQIYEDLNVGSAKVTKEEMQGIPHHLIDIRKSNQNYSVFEFVEDCNKKITEIQSKGKNVIIVGGTGLYIKALTEKYDMASVNKDNDTRDELEKLSNAELCEKLESFGVNLKNDDKNNRHRLIRYCEINMLGGSVNKGEFDDRFVIFGLNSEREVLYQRINKRVDIMANNGLLDETKYLLETAGRECQSFKAIGYKELLPYIDGESTLDECLELLKQKTRNYAKRQITFMNQFKNIIKVNVVSKEQATNEIYEIIKNELNN